MISAEEALQIADQAAQAQNWGRVDSKFHAVLSETKNQPVWHVKRKQPVIGYDFWFTVDAQSAVVIDQGKRGSR